MFYPLVDFPTGDVNKNLGTGRTHFFLPLWLGKQLGLYTVYGGGGYWYNRGHGYKDWFLLDAGMQRRMTDNLRLGFDVFHATSSKTGLKETTGFNLGGAYDLTANHHLLFSVGRRAVRGKLFGCRNCAADSFSSSWPAIVPAIHVFAAGKQDVDARAKPAHDDRSVCNPSCGLVGRAQEFSPDSPARKRGLQNVSETNKLSGYLGYQITF